MTTLDLSPRRTTRVAGVDIAGTEWPLYKLEALGLGGLALLVLFVVTTDPQVAVLGSALAATITWFTRGMYYRRLRNTATRTARNSSRSGGSAASPAASHM
ncbi:hypothetical protein EV641_1353 [Rhodococcus sp. SMB37]|uniref:hypothetical protein n=1 Tax=Rhodococcus sp. SMB37 TaxID=2512213 RepID=UPI000A94BE5F|nr:hypothetical protein [Rhodococcus sp. SMB37]TCN40062.1 hypothetical protein EV641_1353 [Rhodococcus sp. SMB37]